MCGCEIFQFAAAGQIWKSKFCRRCLERKGVGARTTGPHISTSVQHSIGRPLGPCCWRALCLRAVVGRLIVHGTEKGGRHLLHTLARSERGGGNRATTFWQCASPETSVVQNKGPSLHAQSESSNAMCDTRRCGCADSGCLVTMSNSTSPTKTTM